MANKYPSLSEPQIGFCARTEGRVVGFLTKDNGETHLLVTGGFHLTLVELKPGTEATTEEIMAWCRQNLAGYKCPRFVVFTELPKTSTGKIQKFKLRDMAKEV